MSVVIFGKEALIPLRDLLPFASANGRRQRHWPSPARFCVGEGGRRPDEGNTSEGLFL